MRDPEARCHGHHRRGLRRLRDLRLPDEAIDMLEAIGPKWTTYYQDKTYEVTAMMLRQAGF